MKKLFTLIALAMSFVGGYAQETYKEFTENTLLETTKEFIEAEVSNDWVKATGLKAVTNKKATIDPKTDEEIDPTVVSGINVKGVSRTYTFAVANVVEAVAYVLNNSSTASRKFVIKAIPETGTEISKELALDGAKSGKLSMALNSSTKYKISVESYEVSNGSGGDMTLFALKLNTTESLTTAKSSFSTYAASYPVDYSSLGLDAYAITLDEANMKVKYNKIDGVVPANTPVLVKGEPSKTYSLTKATADGTSVATDLQVSDGTITGDGSTIYAFGTKDGVSGFKVVASGVKIPAKKGYLKLSSSAAAKDFFAFGGETTGISNISANGIDEEETPLFNLAGQRVDKSYKGVVVKNGKKFVNK